MGAEVFYNRAKGTSAKDCFRDEYENACYEHGHGGYSGTLAEKGMTMRCTMISGVMRCVYQQMMGLYSVDGQVVKIKVA
jgi:hypothetical protein